MRRTTILTPLAAALAALFPASGGTPPAPLVAYEGQLRDAAGAPLSGTFDMVFRLFDVATGGAALIADSHAGPGAVGVANGTFSAAIGGGAVTDGPGAGVYVSIDEVFRDVTAAWLEIEIAGETLAPRLRLTAAPAALNAAHLRGLAPGFFLDASAAPQKKPGQIQLLVTSPQFGLVARGAEAGLRGTDLDDISDGWLGWNGWGVRGTGDAGGYFFGPGGTATIAGYGTGIEANGVGVGGALQNDASPPAAVNLATGQLGVRATGSYCGTDCGGGGQFIDTLYTGKMGAAVGDTGVAGSGSFQGGEFGHVGGLSIARTAFGHWGLAAESSGTAGRFVGLGWNSWASLATADYGVHASRGSFSYAGDGLDEIDAAPQGIGVRAFVAASGPTETRLGAVFKTPNVFGWVANRQGDNLYSIYGLGLKSFVQNDPTDAGRQLVFVALEGDEAGTYTRGTARLVDGEARVRLGDGFARVTNPDVGLTAIVTPRDAAVPLAVAALSTGELVVRGAAGQADDVVFDYVVQGLRLGFERFEVQKPRTDAVPFPAEPSGPAPESSALARFVAMRSAMGDGPPDLSRAEAMRGAARRADGQAAGRSPAEGSDSTRNARMRETPVVGAVAVGVGAMPLSPGEPIASGELVALRFDAAGPRLARATEAPDETPVGIVLEPASGALAPPGSVVTCAVDASSGAIEVGTLLGPSTSPGRARAVNGLGAPALARALEPLAAGTGMVRVLVLVP